MKMINITIKKYIIVVNWIFVYLNIKTFIKNLVVLMLILVLFFFKEYYFDKDVWKSIILFLFNLYFLEYSILLNNENIFLWKFVFFKLKYLICIYLAELFIKKLLVYKCVIF